MPACIQSATVTTADGPVTVLVPSPDVTCPAGFVVLASAELQDMQARITALESAPDSTELPPADQMSAAWGASFVLVVGCYVIARQVGAVVNFLK